MSYSPYTNQYQSDINKQVGQTAQNASKWGAVALYQAVIFSINFVKEMLRMVFGK